jgi:hypothetical protein
VSPNQSQQEDAGARLHEDYDEEGEEEGGDGDGGDDDDDDDDYTASRD